MLITDRYPLISDDFRKVDETIHRELTSGVPLVEQIAEYIVDSGGKRLRPLIALLTGRTLGLEDDRLIDLAVIIEFLHTATLLHDDVVDTSELRRGRPTANTRWGNGPSVLVGDFLYSRAFQLMVRIRNMPVMNCLADATNVISEGEVLQLLNVRNPEVGIDDYFRVIEGKTAMLFAAATEAASLLAEADPTQTEAARSYGIALGMAFQIQDDVLDYSGDQSAMGKNIGDDLAEGKVTLPLIYALREAGAEDRRTLRRIIRDGDEEAWPIVSELVGQSGAAEWCRKQAIGFGQQARDALTRLPDGAHADTLQDLITLAVDRDR